MAIAELFSGLKPVADAAPAARQAEKRISDNRRDGGGVHGGKHTATQTATAGSPSTVTSRPQRADARADVAGDVDGGGAWDKRAAIVEYEAGAPREWAEGLATLETSGPPSAWPPAEWRQVVHDAGVFLDDWGRQAAALGWTVGDIFGCCRRAPRARLDALGLVALVRGGRVVALTADTARIQHKTGGVTKYRRRPNADARDGLLWQACGDGGA